MADVLDGIHLHCKQVYYPNFDLGREFWGRPGVTTVNRSYPRAAVHKQVPETKKMENVFKA